MSNNDLPCNKCGCQHHPIECPKDGDWIEEIIKDKVGTVAINGIMYNTNADIASRAIRAGISARLPEKGIAYKFKHKDGQVADKYATKFYNQYESEVRKALLGKGE